MVLDKRRAHLLSIIQQSTTPVPTKILMDKMKVSQRTIYYDLEQINNWLTEQNLAPIQSIHGQGLFLDHESKSKINDNHDGSYDEWQYQLSKQERILLIKAKILLEERETWMNDFMELTNMSRGTVAKALREVKHDFEQHALFLHYKKGLGYYLKGAEESKRKALSEVLATIYSHKDWHNVMDEIHLMIQTGTNSTKEETDQRISVKSLLYEAEQKLGLTLTDEMVDMLSFQILMIMKRINSLKFVQVEREEKEILLQTDAYQASRMITNKLETLFGIQFPQDEVCFITMHLLGSKVQHDDFSKYTEQELVGLQAVVQRMITDFQTFSCVIFDDQKGLEQNLISHIKPTYYRLKYGVRIANELSESIQETYQDIYHLTKRVMMHLEYYVGQPIPEEEIAYITLHFGGWLTKEKKKIETKYQAIIICENGIGTSNMLRTQLENLIAGLDVIATLSTREYQNHNFNVDVIFSTNFIKQKSTPVIHVPAILTNVEKEHVMLKMNELFRMKQMASHPTDHMTELVGMIGQYATIHEEEKLRQALTGLLEKKTPQEKELSKPMLNELLTNRTIQFRDYAADWEEAIRIASHPLLEQGSITPDYIDAMITNVNELGPYIVIAPRIAIPHARPDTGVEKLGMSLLRLNQPVYFSEKEKHRAQLIIVLAAIDNETHLKALTQLTEVLSNEKNIDHLIASDHSDSVIELINQNVEA